MRKSKGSAPLGTRIPGRQNRGFPTGPIRGSFSKGAGFALIELLVVIAVIALLMAILLPSLQRAGTGDVRGGTFHALGKVGFQINMGRRVDYYGSYGSFMDGSPEESA